MKLKKSEIKEIIKEIISELKILKFWYDDMETLHSNGQVEKDGIFYQYYEPVEESSKQYGKSLEKIANDRKLKSISKTDRNALKKIAALMKKANEGKNKGLWNLCMSYYQKKKFI